MQLGLMYRANLWIHTELVFINQSAWIHLNSDMMTALNEKSQITNAATIHPEGDMNVCTVSQSI